MPQTVYRVTRLGPDAPRRRAGREWAVGETLAVELTAAQVRAIGADPRYRIEEGARDEGRGARKTKNPDLAPPPADLPQ